MRRVLRRRHSARAQRRAKNKCHYSARVSFERRNGLRPQPPLKRRSTPSQPLRRRRAFAEPEHASGRTRLARIPLPRPAPVGGDRTTRYNDVRQLLPTNRCWTRPAACGFAYGSSNLCLRVTSIRSASLPAGVPRRRGDARATPFDQITALTPVATTRSDPSGSTRLNAAHLYSSDPPVDRTPGLAAGGGRRAGPTQS